MRGLGHRNLQGIAWDNQGRLWTTEHGQRAYEEINLIEKGKNYNWSLIRGDGEKVGLEKPILHSGNETWAPSGIALFSNKLFFAVSAAKRFLKQK